MYLKKKNRKALLLSAVLAVLCAGLYLSGAGVQADHQIGDQLFQQGNYTSGRVFLLEIDSKSLEELGPYQTWTRDYMAQAVERLNEVPEQAPAVIGIDVLYIGETTEEADEHLAQACSSGNVVTGSLFNMESTLQEDEKGYYMAEAVTLYEEPFEELRKTTKQGFVNGFSDQDGIIRHGLLSMNLPDGRSIPSFAYVIYQKYAEVAGLPLTPRIPVNKSGYWYLSYQAEPGGYSNAYSFSDFIQGEIPTDRFAGSIVLIGPYAEGLMDSHKTAIDHAIPMYGVEIHANMIDAMINEDFKVEAGKGIMAALIGLAAFLLCLACGQDRLRYSILLGVAGCIGYPVVAYFCYQKGLVLNVLYIPLICFAIPVFNVGIHYIRTLTQKRMVEKTFKRYVAPEVVDKIMKTGMDQITLGGVSLDIACLFVDIRGFTTMSELLSPEEVVEILNQYLELTSSCIFKHHGTLDKFIGDATMAIFNAPLPQEDYVYEAVLTAWDMVKGAKTLGEELERKYGRSVSFGVGVHCGKAVVGNIGTARRMDYTAIGDTVNVAARLEANAPGGTILISSTVYEKLKGRIQVTSLGNLPLKGKSEKLEIFRIEKIEE